MYKNKMILQIILCDQAQENFMLQVNALDDLHQATLLNSFPTITTKQNFYLHKVFAKT